MTESRRCRWCGGSFLVPPGPGRPRQFCRHSHRQRAYEARRLAEQHHLGSDDVLIGRKSFEALRDALYRIETALDDVDADLRQAVEHEEYRRALWHLYRAAVEVRGLPVEPRAVR